VEPDTDEPPRACGTLGNREVLQRCDWAICEFCHQGYVPWRIRAWCDPDGSGQGQTAVCPACGVAAVVGYAERGAFTRER
jgi:hypothetical protein